MTIGHSIAKGITALLIVAGCVSLRAQTTTTTQPGEPQSTEIKPPDDGKTTPAAVTTPLPKHVAPYVMPKTGTEVDRIVAVVGQDLILESDIDEERRFLVLDVYPDPGSVGYTRQAALERLIDRTLILQQIKLQPQPLVTDAAVTKEIDGLRRDIPSCHEAHCETEAGWKAFLAKNGFTEAEVMTRWRERMQTLAYVEQRFSGSISITPEQIQEYYTKTMLPVYRKANVPPPALDTVSARVQEVLLQQQIGNLLEDWLKSLRAQGTVLILRPGEEAP